MSWYFAFFLCSGFASLVYEIVWLRLAMAAFGVTTPLVSIVLSTFMAGLALGSWGAGVLTRRLTTPDPAPALRLYALAELIIGVSGVAVPRELAWGREALGGAGGVTWDSSSYYLASALWIALTLLPYCLCMGATFPLAMAAMRKEFGGRAVTSFSFLYLANVLGATTGTALSAFVLIELLGFRGTLLLATSLNGLLAVAAFARSRGRYAVVAALSGDPTRAGSPPPAPAALLGWLFMTGFISMAMEVVWIRQFTPYLGTVVYTFAGILALYLTATCAGSRIYRGWIRSPQPTMGLVMAAWTGLGLLGLIPVVAADFRLPLPGPVRIAIAIVPFCGVVGFLTPMLVDRWSSGTPERAGMAYATNVVGSILGPLFAGFVLLPSFGERYSHAMLALPLFLPGLLAWVRPGLVTGASVSRKWAPALFAGTVVVSAVTLLTTKSLDDLYPASQVRRDHTATVVATGEGMDKRLLVNGVGMTRLSPVAKMMAHLPMAHLRHPPQDGLVIAFGMGTTFRSLLAWNIRVTTVELVPGVPPLFGYFHQDGPALLRSPLARLVIDDGRRFLERSHEQYDVITLDPPPPVEAAGSSLLYSREFYATARKRLRPNGILHQWFPGGERATLASAARAVDEVFPHARVFVYPGNAAQFLASTGPIPVETATVLASRLPATAAVDLLEWNQSSTAERRFKSVLDLEVPLDTVLAAAPSVPTLEDNRPFNEYFLVRRTAEKSLSEILWSIVIPVLLPNG